MSTAFEVIACGPPVTVQDLGRSGFQRFGMPVAGAMDAFALQVGNILVGNPPDQAALEIPMGGLTLRAVAECIIAITGADLGATLDGASVPLWESFRIQPGQELVWHMPVSGLWSYLAVGGGIDVPAFMGSRSTYLRAAVGGLSGRRLCGGDILHVAEPTPARPTPGTTGRKLPSSQIPTFGGQATARVVLGPHEDHFTAEALATFLGSSYTVSPQSDRMGYRFEGPLLQHAGSADILSEAVAPGTIQVPGNGQPIILLADRQTTGGYPQIATVIGVDLPQIAQLTPGCEVRFREVDLQEAQDLAIRQAKALTRLQSI